jgi:hypothetical protein
MSRKILAILVLLSASLQAYNQKAPFVPESYLGLKAGGTMSSVLFTPLVSQETNLGFTGGLVFKHFGQRNLGIQLEINYMQAGWNEGLDDPDSYSRRLNYLQIPFMTHANLGKRKTRVVLNVGPYVSLLLSEKEQIKLEDELDMEDYYQTEIDNVGDFGLCVGLGLLRHSSIGTIQIEGRLNQGLSSIYESGFDNTFQFSRNQIIEVALYYMFDISKN